MVHLEKKSQSVFSVFADRRAVIMLFLGFSAGIPILLIFSSLSLWLGEAGVERKAVTFFSWAALGYSFKFVWAPLVDEIPLPWFSRVLGRRRSWLLLAQLLIITAIGMMALTVSLTFHFFTHLARKPQKTPNSMAPKKPVCT